MTTIEKKSYQLFLIMEKRRLFMFTGYVETPIGFIEVKANQSSLLSVLFVEEKLQNHENDIVTHFTQEIEAYFKGQLTNFTFPSLNGTHFQCQVWSELAHIPYSETNTYSEIAHTIQKEKAVRAVGTAIGKNNFAIVIPCHRVIGKNGALTGYAWGTWRKEWLLTHEKNHSQL